MPGRYILPQFGSFRASHQTKNCHRCGEPVRAGSFVKMYAAYPDERGGSTVFRCHTCTSQIVSEAHVGLARSGVLLPFLLRRAAQSGGEEKVAA
jgi:hypothetical protein